MKQDEGFIMVNEEVWKIIILSPWSEQQGHHSPVGDNVCHYASPTITQCLGFTKEMPV